MPPRREWLPAAGAVRGLHHHPARAAQAQVDLAGFQHRVVVALGHEALVADQAGIQLADAVPEVAVLFRDGRLERLVVHRVVPGRDQPLQGRPSA